jgi:hypothetical protein
MRKIENTFTIQSQGKFPMPVLLTCPHGGREKLEQTQEREIFATYLPLRAVEKNLVQRRIVVLKSLPRKPYKILLTLAKEKFTVK